MIHSNGETFYTINEAWQIHKYTDASNSKKKGRMVYRASRYLLEGLREALGKLDNADLWDEYNASLNQDRFSKTFLKTLQPHVPKAIRVNGQLMKFFDFDSLDPQQPDSTPATPTPSDDPCLEGEPEEGEPAVSDGFQWEWSKTGMLVPVCECGSLMIRKTSYPNGSNRYECRQCPLPNVTLTPPTNGKTPGINDLPLFSLAVNPPPPVPAPACTEPKVPPVNPAYTKQVVKWAKEREHALSLADYISQQYGDISTLDDWLAFCDQHPDVRWFEATAPTGETVVLFPVPLIEKLKAAHPDEFELGQDYTTHFAGVKERVSFRVHLKSVPDEIPPHIQALAAMPGTTDAYQVRGFEDLPDAWGFGLNGGSRSYGTVAQQAHEQLGSLIQNCNQFHAVTFPLFYAYLVRGRSKAARAAQKIGARAINRGVRRDVQEADTRPAVEMVNASALSPEIYTAMRFLAKDVITEVVTEFAKPAEQFVNAATSTIVSAIPTAPFLTQPMSGEWSGLRIPISVLNDVAYRHTGSQMFKTDGSSPTWDVWLEGKPVKTDTPMIYAIFTNVDRGSNLRDLFSIGETGIPKEGRIGRGHERIRLLQQGNYLCKVLYYKLPSRLGKRESIERALQAELHPVWEEWSAEEKETFRQSCGVYAA